MRLLRAGFLVAQGFVEDPVAREELQTVIGPESRATRTLAGAKAAVKQFVASPTALASACRTLHTLEWFAGVEVTDCERS